ncbi:MAG: gamma-glutamyltransferase, partial [Pseudolabrys sp.]
NRGAGFNLTPGHPDSLGPAKRPLGTSGPALGLRDGRCELSLGVMGGHYQSLGHAQMIMNIVDYGMDMQQSIDTPRLFFDGDRTTVERGFPAATREGLTARGHTLVDVKPPWGGAQIIEIDWDRGVLIGGSESRKDGCALGY